MKRFILALAVVALPAQAFDWPWQQQTHADYSYCKGFVNAGLGEFPVENLSRVKLWLSWNHITRAELPGGIINQDEFKSGSDRFTTLLAASDLDSLLQIANKDCELGPS